MSGSVQWTEITSLVDYTICGPQIKLVLDGPCWSVAAENLKKPKNANGRLAIPAPAGLLVHKDVDIEAVACVHNLQYSSVQLLIYSQTDFLAAR